MEVKGPVPVFAPNILGYTYLVGIRQGKEWQKLGVVLGGQCCRNK